jgi:Arc/MetJ-type ribon-helix-helix transcriptional regulator
VAPCKLLHSIVWRIVEKIFSSLPPAMKALLDQCIARGLYGDQAATIRHFISAGLERLVDQGRLIDLPTLLVPSDSGGKDGEGETKN